MANSTPVAVRVPDDLLKLLDSKVNEKKATDRKVNRSQLILDAVEAYLGNTILDTVSMPNSQTVLDSKTLSDIVESALTPIRQEMEDLRGKLTA